MKIYQQNSCPTKNLFYVTISKKVFKVNWTIFIQKLMSYMFHIQKYINRVSNSNDTTHPIFFVMSPHLIRNEVEYIQSFAIIFSLHTKMLVQIRVRDPVFLTKKAGFLNRLSGTISHP